MFAQLSDRTTAITFIALTLLISLSTATVAGGLILAISPLLVVLAMLLLVTREGYSRSGWRRLGISRLGLPTWPLALATTAGVNLLAIAGVVALGFAQFIAPGGDWWRDALILSVTGPILAFAEEIGWRGFLQPRLAFLGEPAAMLVIGIVWVAWHLPYILLTPHYHSDGNRTLVLGLFTVSVIAVSFLFGYLRIVSDSVWPVVLAHFAHNASFALLSTYAITTDRPVVVNEYLAGDTGLLVLVGTIACVVAIRLSRSVMGRRPVQASGRG